MEKKWQHLVNKQSKLSLQKEARPLLEKLNIPQEQLERKISIKGYLFHPNSQQCCLPNLASTQKLSPYYYIDELPSQSETLFLLPKHRWLSQTHNKNDVHIISQQALQDLLDKKQSPLLIAYGKSTKDGVLIENERAFVCPRTWPYCLIKPFKTLHPKGHQASIKTVPT